MTDITEAKLEMALRCCEPECELDAEYQILTVRDGGGVAGPDPYSDETHACIDHVGGLLGCQPDAKSPNEIYWQVRYIGKPTLV